MSIEDINVKVYNKIYQNLMIQDRPGLSNFR